MYEALGGFDTSYRISADYEALLRYFSSEKLVPFYLEEIVSIMRTGGTSNKNPSNLFRKMREDFSIMKKHELPAYQCLIAKNVSKLKQFLV